MTDSSHLVVFSTAADSEQAGIIAQAVVTERLAACVNIVSGVRSVYRWNDKLVNDDECLLIMKTTESGFERLRDRIQSLHSYDVPEIVGIPATAAESYARFIDDNVG